MARGSVAMAQVRWHRTPGRRSLLPGRPRNTLLNIMLIIGTLREAGRKEYYPARPVTANMSFGSCLVAPYVAGQAFQLVRASTCRASLTACCGLPSQGRP